MPPPMVVFPFNKLPASLFEIDPGDWLIEKTKTGWVDGLAFYKYITQTFLKWCFDNDVEFPIVLFVDGHKSHVTMSLYNFCEANQIELMPLCPNASEVTQPMDVALYGPIEYYWMTNYNKWRRRTSSDKLLKKDFVTVLKSTIRQMNCKNKLIEGFELCGLVPFRVDAIEFEKLPKSKKLKLSS